MSTFEKVTYVVTFLLIVSFAAVIIKFGIEEGDTQTRELWGQGYCAALNGEWLNVDTCNVDGRVVAIPADKP